MAKKREISVRRESPKSVKKVGAAVIIGTSLEWFDFYLYASMAALVFGKVFFPSANSSASTLAAFSTFAVGFLARPFGGILFGILGDRIGRKAVLSISLLIMGIASGLIGLVPSYAAIGVAAPALLIILRILQGFGASAELGSAITVAYEHADEKTRGRYGAYPVMGAQIGLLAASLAVAAVTSLDDEALYTWGWRVPFIASFAIVIVGYWIRRAMPESEEFEKVATEARQRKGFQVLRDLVRGNWRGLVVVAAVYGGYSALSYTFKTFSLSYLTEFQGVAKNVGALGVTFASIAAIIACPLIGRLSDRVDTRKVMIGAAIGVALMAFPAFWLFDTGRSPLIWGVMVVTTGVLAPMIMVAASPYMARQFPTEVRASGIGTGREVSGAAAGGLAPILALTMVTMSPSHSTWGVSLLIIGCAVLVVVGGLFDQSRRVTRDATAPSEVPEALEPQRR
ncbi:MFS transporter [Rhodococcus koreensis]|uniref:Predicted arabinose efflux permease, MFS family n=1 Tax=Rhodococcus koreensis TaxID=99653 RepID=A0A1H4WUV7_9NOCA|nr:MFS transporter [Rhodococcus koreensis]QSE80595.1 MHS family MFS transporter [Rhodococcus koreensis]SEC97005.1 Predicted arabinose efflux permease, MFS family [Rhodococcus koreensis]